MLKHPIFKNIFGMCYAVGKLNWQYQCFIFSLLITGSAHTIFKTELSLNLYKIEILTIVYMVLLYIQTMTLNLENVIIVWYDISYYIKHIANCVFYTTTLNLNVFVTIHKKIKVKRLVVQVAMITLEQRCVFLIIRLASYFSQYKYNKH